MGNNRVLVFFVLVVGMLQTSHADKKMMELLQAGNYQDVMEYFNSLDTAKDAHAQAIVSHAIKTGTFKDLEWSCSNWYNNTGGCFLLRQLSQDKQLTFIKKTEELKDFFRIPYYSHYFSTYLDRVFNYDIFKNLCCHQVMNSIMKQLVDFTEAEIVSGNVVLCHGQRSEWAFLQHVYREILSIKTKKFIPDDFIALRFNDALQLDQQMIQNLRSNDYWHVVGDWYSEILFTTLVPFQNHAGSNSFYYAVSNSNVYSCSVTVQTLFTDAGMQQEYDWIMFYYPMLLQDLETLYIDANNECGDCGNIIAFSFPEAVADQLCYPVHPGGYHRSLNILSWNAIFFLETRLSKIIKHFDQVGHGLEIALILAPEVLDPWKAQKAGIKMKYFGPMITNNTSKYQEFKNKLAEVMELVKERYSERERKQEKSHRQAQYRLYYDV